MPAVNPRAALIVVDVQNGFVNAESAHVVPRIANLVRRWPGPVVFSRFVNAPGSSFERLMGWRRLQGPPETDLVAELEDLAETVIDKGTYTVFADAGRAVALAQGWTEVWVCGIDTECCVLATAVGAFEMGLAPYVLVDYSASHAGAAAHEAGLYLLGRLIGKRQVVYGDPLSSQAFVASA